MNAARMSRCGCGALLPMEDGPTHRYMLSTAACWAGYGRVLEREYSTPARWSAHRLCVDAYAAQHPGKDAASARNSVYLHLCRLALRVEHGWAFDRIDAAMPLLARTKGQRPWLEPPVFTGLTFLHVLAAEDDATHLRAVEAWAASVWRCWERQHAVVDEWIAALVHG